MKRKDFIGNGLLLGLGLPLVSSSPEPELPGKQPPFLRPGDIIAITSPAGFVTLEEVTPAIRQMESWGLKVRLGSTIGKKDGTFGGTDDERAADFEELLKDPAVKAIMCARGGYGFVRIIDRIDFGHLRRHPKWLIGFSDITVLHNHVNRHYGIATLHSKMCNSFPSDWNAAEPIQMETILSIKRAIMGENLLYTAPAHPQNKPGKAEGVLVGGNLRILENLAGSASDIHTRGKILFLEDTGEYLYSIDRMFWNLKRSGKLEHLSALVVGGFKIKPAEKPEEEFGKNLYEIVLEKLEDCSYPVCFDFPVGHQKNNFALKCGVRHQLLVTELGATLREIL